MKRARFLMIGGFLGAGKTTTIARLARHYTDQGLSVGLVTNDQAYNLVDTESLRAQGFNVGEVPGACFCCKFDDLVQTAKELSEETAPDLIITEPVGSCTDLVATVIEPMRHLYGDQYEIAPLAVILKPEHGMKILRDEQVGFSPKAAYIFLKQIEEADIVAVNKVDKLSDDQRAELINLVSQRFPDKRVLAMSARDGEGVAELIDQLSAASERHETFMEVDYEVYAEGEAELGWLNCQATFTGETFSLDKVLVALVQQLRDGLADENSETAHLKVLGQANNESAIANLVGGGADVELSLESGVKTSECELIVNARVAIDPEVLEQIVTDSVSSIANRFDLGHSIAGVQRFRPSPPVPTHRMTAP